jgi:CheY-like chemotaxis protein
MSATEFTDTFTVAIEGFSTPERDALRSVFKLAVRRSPAFQQGEEAGVSDFLIADADSAPAVTAVRRGQRLGDTVFIGSKAPAGASAWLPRPIVPAHVLRELEVLVELRLSLPDPPSEMMPLGPIEDTEPLAPPPAVAATAPRVERRRRPRPPKPVWRGGGGREVLLVEDSAIARQFLKRRLYHLGYKVHDCASGEAALEILSKRTFGMAFLDIGLGPPGSIDGLQLCQRLKQRGAHAAGLRTVVVMVTGLEGATDRVRGSLAGCDAYLTKPLHEAEFIATLLQVDPEFEWEGAAAAPAAPASV